MQLCLVSLPSFIPRDCLHFVAESRSTIGSGPVDPPTLSGHPCPEQAFHRRATCMVIQRGSALVKAACVPRFGKTEALAVEMMAKLVANSAEEGAEWGDLFPDGGPHPETDEHGFGTVVAEQLNGRASLTNSKRAGCKHSDPWLTDFVEAGCKRQKLRTCLANGRGAAAPHGQFDRPCRHLQPVVQRDFQGPKPVAFSELCLGRCFAW